MQFLNDRYAQGVIEFILIIVIVVVVLGGVVWEMHQSIGNKLQEYNNAL